MALSSDEVLFGRIVVHNKLASDSQVKESMAIAEREGKDLGTVLRAKGILSEKQVELIAQALPAQPVGEHGPHDQRPFTR